ncbi:hypothetical protein RKE29_02065 [Streptomyces sp. B1866]|uniref:hypothetical protein n=1 Tax=Streptomyces sp. B1866 TaxID=3075431 RepID=UPI00288DC574|nr:hypothetical protein [Streptomyces sp. B1866]MDT3395446.1 hypothetical protein [Streptomyces sp. B1866]
MPRGGARSRSGPAPDPNALRRERPSDKAGWTLLPAAGRPGPPPDWPLTEPSVREFDLWRAVWAKPQAVMWEALGQELEVALFVRTLAEAEKPDASTERRKVARQYQESLGLTVSGMLRNRWKVADGVQADEAPGDERLSAAGAPRRRSARDRMKVVPFERPSHGDEGA